jgi:hypothetical protein
LQLAGGALIVASVLALSLQPKRASTPAPGESTA